MDNKLRELQRKALTGDTCAMAQLGQELIRSLDVLSLVSGLAPEIQAALAQSTLSDKMIDAVAGKIASDLDASDLAAYIDVSDVASEIDITEVFDTSDIIDNLDMTDIAREIDMSNLGEHIDMDDLANSIDMDELAKAMVRHRAKAKAKAKAGNKTLRASGN